MKAHLRVRTSAVMWSCWNESSVKYHPIHFSHKDERYKAYKQSLLILSYELKMQRIIYQVVTLCAPMGRPHGLISP